MESKYKYIDIHTHLNLEAFKEDWKEVAKRALDASVAHINVGTQLSTSKRAVELAEMYDDGVYATVGLHPIHTSKSFHDKDEIGEEGKEFASSGEKFDASDYNELVKSNKVVAIGECGFDYFRVEKDTKEVQEETFVRQIEFANELNKPLMLHVRPSAGSMDAYEDAVDVLKKHAKVLGVVHFFVGNLDVAKKFWDIGFNTSFTGVITFADQYDEVIKNAPLDMIHADTDAPYVAPMPHRGKRNEPLYVKEIFKRIAELRGEDEEKVRVQLLENACKLFKVEL